MRGKRGFSELSRSLLYENHRESLLDMVLYKVKEERREFRKILFSIDKA
jgi:hypothetical protein